MPGCVLRLSGPHAALATAVQGAFVTFIESYASKSARERGKTTEADDSTFNFTVSNADGSHVPVQVREAEMFVSEHLKELIELRSRAGVENGVLDFGWDVPNDSVNQCNCFPSSFLSLCAEAKLDIEVSLYVFDVDEQEA